MALGCSLAVLSALVLTANDARPARDGEVYSHVLTAQKRVERLLIEGLATSIVEDNASTTDRFLKIIAPGRCFVDYIHQVASSNAGSSLWLDPTRNQTWWLPGHATVLRVFERNAFSYPADYAQAFRFALYDQYIAWRPPDDPLESHRLIGGRRFCLVDVFAPEQQPTLTVRPELETYEGDTCHVVIADRGRDQLWISPTYGYALVRRLWRINDEGTQVEYNCRDFTEVQPSVWLPKNCTSELHTKDGSSSGVRVRLTATRLAVNRKVPDALFRPRFPSGTHIYGVTGILESSIPGGTDLLDLWSAVAATHFPATVLLQPITGADQTRMAASAVVLLLGAFLLMRASLPIWKDRRSDRSSC